MLWGLIVLLILLWALGYGVGFTLNGLIHLLIVIAICCVVYQLVTGRRPPL